MSKRFGRNQRRRARVALDEREERIIQLGSALDMQRGLSKHLRERLEELQQVLEDATEIAGRMSVIFPAQTMEIDGPTREMVDVGIERNYSFSELMAMDLTIPMSVRVQRLPVMLADINQSALEESVHLQILFGGRKLGYAVSESALKVRRGQQMEHELMRVLPRMINKKLFGDR